MLNADDGVVGSEFDAATVFGGSLGCPESEELWPESFFEDEAGNADPAPAAKSWTSGVLTDAFPS